MATKKKTPRRTIKAAPRVNLKLLADELGLSPATVSLVMNRSAVADSIPQQTKDRIFAAARKHNYRPNFFARSLLLSAASPLASWCQKSARATRRS